MAKLLNFSESVPDKIDIQVSYASKQKINIIKLTMKRYATIREAIEFSQILIEHPELDIDVCKVGIFGKLKTLNTEVRQGDRVEIYRALTADPMEARRRRFAKQLRLKSP
jgi:hypothetical protein